jgi:hypothetical protein
VTATALCPSPVTTAPTVADGSVTITYTRGAHRPPGCSAS